MKIEKEKEKKNPLSKFIIKKLLFKIRGSLGGSNVSWCTIVLDIL